MEPPANFPPPPRSRFHAAAFHGAWIVLLLLAAGWRFSFPLTPAIDKDFSGYLHPALDALGGRAFAHADGRAILYPALVYALLAGCRDFRAITIVQHTLGLATGLLLLATWCAAWRALRPARLPRWLYDLAGLAMCAAFFFTPQPVQFEFLIRPDVICPFFAALSFFFIVRFLLAWRVEKNARAFLGFGVAAVFTAFVLPSLKPSYWLSSIFTTLPVWCALFDRREKGVRRLLLAVLPLAAVWLLLIMPERRSSRGDTSSATFLPESLFSIHALIIREQLAADVAAPDPAVPYPPEKLRATLALLDDGIAAALRENPGHMASLGYDADYLLYRAPFFTKLAEADHWALEPRLGFYRYYYLRTWKKRPGPMLGKVTGQLALFYNLECPAYCNHGFDMAKYYRIADMLMQQPDEQARIAAWPPAVAFRDSLAAIKDRRTEIGMRKLLRHATNRLGNCYLPGLLAWLASLPWILWRAERRARYGIFAAILAVGYAFNFGNNLGIAILHTLEVSRYTYIQFATTLLTEMLTAVYLLDVALGLGAPFFARGKESAPAAAAPL